MAVATRWSSWRKQICSADKESGRDMTGDKTVLLAAFVLRCAAAATIAYLFASAIGLPHPLWTCIFALIGSQDSELAIITAIGGRIAGTIIGAIVAVAVGVAMHRIGLDLAWQIAVAVAICAMFAWGRPAIQLCMWTPPIILLTTSPDESLISVGFYRGCEVILGLLIGGLLLIAADKSLLWTHRTRPRRHIKS
jgi:uncharacterized membrane protein YgaE (UPF0421/DUF939 family)